MFTDSKYDVQMWYALTGDGLRFLNLTYNATEYSEEQVVVIRIYSNSGACLSWEEYESPLQAIQSVRLHMADAAAHHFAKQEA